MKPTGTRVEFLKEEEHKMGMEVMIMDEFKSDEKFKSFLVGKIQLLDGSERLLGLNQTSYYNISKNQAFGPDTNFWVGLKIKYIGKKKLEKYPAMARVWEGVEPVIDVDKKEPF